MSDQPTPAPVETASASQVRRLALAFQNVFGQHIRRSADQRLVLDHLREKCGRDMPVFRADKIGNFDPLRAAHIDGAQTQYLIIKRQLANARKLTDAAKVKPKAKR
jgi:hypothetical protein